MSAHPRPSLTPEQYLEIERAAEFKSEYYKGEMYAMSGGSARHSSIAHNLGVQLDRALEGTPCRIFTSDLRLRVAPNGLFTYPDVTVVCGEPKLLDHHGDTLTNPTLIVEVLSKSTEARDRGFKFAQYRTLESLREYVLVSQTEPRVEVHYRSGNDGEWRFTEFTGLESRCRLRSLGCEIPLAGIYKWVDFEAAREAAE